jgi:hypothetical protein
MSSPDATLVTEIINFDRNIQEVFYDTQEPLPIKTILKKVMQEFCKTKEVSILDCSYNHKSYLCNQVESSRLF